MHTTTKLIPLELDINILAFSLIIGAILAVVINDIAMSVRYKRGKL